ncbi:MAG TPA: Flp family type IVb pilin [Anaerolineae bacterium]|nr:Flp family type IVb pilin [Anaerolineae bacterium]HQK14318.1 Flp family type IVb pilin [Anaerolineae bacterium]
MFYLPKEEGQGLVEYGLILILIAIFVVIVVSLLGTQISGMFRDLTDQLAGML